MKQFDRSHVMLAPFLERTTTQATQRRKKHAEIIINISMTSRNPLHGSEHRPEFFFVDDRDAERYGIR